MLLLIYIACTAERFFRIDRAQEHLHYMMDIANDTVYLLDSDQSTMAQTPTDDDTTGSSSFHTTHNYNSSGSSDNLDKDSRENTPSSPNKKFLNRSSSGPPPNAGTLLPDAAKGSSKKCKSI